MSPDQWNEVKPSIGPLFDENWRNPKLEAQREEAEEKHLARVEAGRKGGQARKDGKQSFSNATSKTKAKPKQPEPEPEPDSYSDPEPKSDPDVWASEKGRRDTYTRNPALVPYPKPTTSVNGKRFLLGLGVPDSDTAKHLDSLMAGMLTPFDIEDWITQRGAV